MPTLEDVYIKFGEVAEAAQILETQLGNMLLWHYVSVENLVENKNPARATQLVKLVNKKTFGQLLKAISAIEGDQTSTEAAFKRALDERNRLSHSFFRIHNFRRNTPDGCSIMIADLVKIQNELHEAYDIADRISGNNYRQYEGALPTKHVKL